MKALRHYVNRPKLRAGTHQIDGTLHSQYLKKHCHSVSSVAKPPMRLRTLPTTLGLPHTAALIKYMPIDARLNTAQIQSYLQHRAMALFGESADHLLLDFEFLSKEAANAHRIRVVAVHRCHALDQLLACQKLGLRVTTIDIDILAVRRALYYNNLNPPPCDAIVLCYPTHLTLSIGCGTEHHYLKSSPHNQERLTTLQSMLQFAAQTNPDQQPTQIQLVQDPVTKKTKPHLLVPSPKGEGEGPISRLPSIKNAELTLGDTIITDNIIATSLAMRDFIRHEH